MIHFLIIVILLTLAPQEQDLLGAFNELPQQVREQATLIVTGTYNEGRTPCIFMADGTRRWTMESTIRITKVYRGEAGGKFIYLGWGPSLKTRDDQKLMRGQKYLLLLRPSEKSMKAIQAGEYMSVWDALEDEEILAIVELK